jgi:hypothetical protein
MDNSINTLRTIEEIFKRYEELGFYLIPVAHNGKAPLLDPAKHASNSAKQMIEWHNSKKYKGCNWGLLPAKSGLVAIDVDARDGGLELWAELSRELNVRTMTQRSARGGYHYLFRARSGSKYKKPLSKKGIDIQWNNIIVIFPSRLSEGQQYTWIDESPIQELPEKFENLFAATHKADQEPVDFIGIESFVQKVAEQLKTKKFGYDEWVQIGMAIHSSMPGPEGLKIWQDISSGPNMKEGDLEACAYKWNGFSTKGGMTVRSLGFVARELGCETPSLTLEMDKLEFANDKQRMELEADQNPGWFKEKTGRIVSVHKEFVVEDLNRQGFFLEKEFNAGKIGTLRVGEDQHKTVGFMKPADFQLQTATHFFKEYKREQGTGSMKPHYTKVSKLWIESPERKVYDKIIFNHKDEPGALNLWSPLPCTPIKGDVSLFNQLIFDGLANGDMDKAFWLLDWLAHLVQRPWERCSLVPVLIGDQGTGKGMLFDRILKVMLGHFHYKIMTARTLKERFNAEQAFKFLTFIDEATWRGDKEEDGILKSLTGSKMMTVEHKFGGRYAVDNYSRYAIASNNPEAVAIERSNRRYVLFEANPNYSKEHAFFSKLADQLDNGILVQAVFESLLARPLSAFNPQKLPQFNDGQGHQAKVASEGVEAEFWNSVWNHEPKELWLNDDTLLKDVAFSEFIQYANRTRAYKKSLSPEVFWRKTNNYFRVEHLERARARIAGKRREVLKIRPKTALENFCDSLKLNRPTDFDATDYIFADESKLLSM